MSKVAANDTTDWVNKARNGDREAFVKLMEIHHNGVWRFLLKWVKNAEDAEDLAQETFLAAWQRLPGFRGDSQFSTWILGIALNIARNHYNRTETKHSAEELPDEDHLDSLLPHYPDPYDLTEKRITLEVLERAIAGLSPEMREVIVLVGLESLPLEQVAVILSVPIGTVKSRLFRAREKLARQMQDYLE